MVDAFSPEKEFVAAASLGWALLCFSYLSCELLLGGSGLHGEDGQKLGASDRKGVPGICFS